MTENSSSELMAMTLIANSGDARSLAFQALEEAKVGILMKQIDYLKNRMRSPKSPIIAQTELPLSEANGDHLELNVLLVHAQDHLMTSYVSSRNDSRIYHSVQKQNKSHLKGEIIMKNFTRMRRRNVKLQFLCKKWTKYWEEQGQELTIKAVGLGDYENVYKDFDYCHDGPSSVLSFKRSKRKYRLANSSYSIF